MKERERRRRKAEPVAAADVVARVLDGYHLTEPVRHARLALEWSRIVGSRIGARTQPGMVDNGILHLRVSNSSWLHQLSFLRTDIITAINSALGDPPLVNDLRLHLGSARHTAPAPAKPGPTAVRRTPLRRAPHPPAASGEALRAIEAESMAIDDPELRAIITEARRLINR